MVFCLNRDLVRGNHSLFSLSRALLGMCSRRTPFLCTPPYPMGHRFPISYFPPNDNACRSTLKATKTTRKKKTLTFEHNSESTHGPFKSDQPSRTPCRMNMSRIQGRGLSATATATPSSCSSNATRDHLTSIAAHHGSIVRQRIPAIVTLADAACLSLIAVVVVVVGCVLGRRLEGSRGGMDGEDANDTLVQILAIVGAENLLKQRDRVSARDL